MQNKFYIEYFTPKHLKTVDDALDVKLKRMQEKHKKYTSVHKKLIQKPTLWNKMRHTLHID